MRAHRTFGLSAVAMALTLLPGCPSCPSADRADPRTPWGDPPLDPPVAGPARFIAASSLGANAQITLIDAELRPVTFRVPPSSRTETTSWIATLSRWPNMRGTGIGRTPTLPPAITPGVPGLVTIIGATSIIALGLPTGQEDWEWVEPPSDEGTRPPVLDVLVVPDIALEMHDLAFLARDRIAHGSTPFGSSLTIGGDVVVLDVEINIPVVATTLTFDSLVTDGIPVTPRALAFAGGFVYVALDHGQVVGPMGSPLVRVGDGLVAVIDPVARTVRHVLRFPGLTHCTQVVTLGAACGTTNDPDHDYISSLAEGSGDADSDGVPNAMDLDSDGDGIADVVERGNPDCRLPARDADGDGTPDFLDVDASPPSMDPPAGRVVVACAGTPDQPGAVPDDAGFVLIDRDPTGTEAPAITRTIRAELLSIPSPDRGLVALRGSYVAFVSSGTNADPILADRLFVVNLQSDALEILHSAPSDSETLPGGLGRGAYDPIGVPVPGVTTDAVPQLVVPAGRTGLFAWSLVPDSAMPDVVTFRPHDVDGDGSADPVPLEECLGLPVRDVRLIP
jgi:hypothetical protein